MRTGRLNISRGSELRRQAGSPVPRDRSAGSSAPLKPPAGPGHQGPGHQGPVAFAPHPANDPLSLADVRINALERLTALAEKGTITLDEFRMEKALILRLTGEELLLTEIAPQPEAIAEPKASGWRLVPGFIAVVTFLTLVSIPDTAAHLIGRALTAIGA